jgi:hypothetical protein
MMKSKLNINIVILIIVIAVYSFLCLSKHQYNRLTADSMLYFSIADKYLSGDLQNAINGYWGPLLAWLIMPFLFFGINDVLAINILNLMFGILSLLGVWILTVRFEIAGKIKGILLICMLPIVLQFSLVQPMDFLLVCILIFYVGIVFDVDYPKKINAGVFSGILGSLAYFTKAYAFPFFIVHFFLMNLLHYIRITAKVERKKVVKNAVAGFALFFLMSGIWIMIISDKYGHVTFSTMRDTNFNAPGPDVVGGGLEFGVPVFKEGFFEPPNKTAFVIWEDPSYLRGEPWNAWQSLRHFKHFIKLMLKNVSDGLKIFESFSSLSVVILIAYILLLSGRSKNEILSHGVLLYPLFTIILFSGGYLLFHFEARYLWLTNILLLLMGGHVISDLFRKEFFRSDLRKNILIVVFTISFIFVPTKYFVQAGREGMDRDMYHISTDLNQYNIRGNLASNREHVPVHDAWHKTFRLAYWLDSRYYGQSREGISDDDLKIELEKFNIDYYFLWGNGDSVPRFLTKYQEVTKNIIPGLKVFSLKSTVVPSDLRQNQQ